MYCCALNNAYPSIYRTTLKRRSIKTGWIEPRGGYPPHRGGGLIPESGIRVQSGICRPHSAVGAPNIGWLTCVGKGRLRCYFQGMNPPPHPFPRGRARLTHPAFAGRSTRITWHESSRQSPIPRSQWQQPTARKQWRILLRHGGAASEKVCCTTAARLRPLHRPRPPPIRAC